jgi:hypothetical protein
VPSLSRAAPRRRILTIGTGLGNASFASRDDIP